jgi:hypothetical protein
MSDNTNQSNHQTEILSEDDIRRWELEIAMTRNDYVLQLLDFKTKMEIQISKTENIFARKKLMTLFYRIGTEIEECVKRSRENNEICTKSVVHQVI